MSHPVSASLIASSPYFLQIKLSKSVEKVRGHFTTQEVAKLLRVNQRTVQEWIRTGALTAVRYGRLLRIRQADLASFGEVLTRHTPPSSVDASPSPAPAGAAQE
jgi:excisionase family DNA binding protein